MEKIIIDKEKIKEELIEKNLFSLQKDLIKQRRRRILVMYLLLFSFALTIIYGTLENPFKYTLSKIGNYFTYRWVFIVWAMVTGFAIQIAILVLFHVEEYKAKHPYIYNSLSAIFLTATAIIPSLSKIYPFWHFIHTLLTVFYAISVFLSINPFVIWVGKNNPRLRFFLNIWLGVIWIGSLFPIILFGKTGMFELWFFLTLIIFLLYLSLVLFEEKIVKMSVAFLKNEKDLNIAIEKIYVNLEKDYELNPFRKKKKSD